MRALDLKLVRDLRHLWPQLLAIAGVVGAGVGVCLTMLSALASLQFSRDDYYATSQFADVFASVKRVPESAVMRLRDIPGIEVVESRVVADVTIDVPGLPEPATGRVISIPDQGESQLNRLLLRRGTYPGVGRGDQVLASEAFVNAHRLQIGSTVAAVINGRWRRLSIVGVALSPEYVYSIRPGDLFPDDKRFGVFWMRRRDLAAAFDLEGAFNDVAIRLSYGAVAADVIGRVDRVLAPYGGLGAYERKDQTSAWYLDNEFTQLSNMGCVTPFIFAGVAAFLLNIVIARLVATQREQIGVLKAFGYSNVAVAWHYVTFVLAVAAAGIAIGIVVGAYAGSEWTRLYAMFFRFPRLAFVFPARVVGGATIVTAILAAAAGFGAATRAAAVPPAEAMRPAAPLRYRTGVLDRLMANRFVPLTARMVFRNLERRPTRSLLSVVAIALAVAIVIVGIFTVDAVHYLTDVQFNAAQRQDMTVTFKELRSRRALHELAHLPGVVRAEPTRTVAVRLRHANRSRRLGLVGISEQATLARVVDERLRPVTLPGDGIVLNDALANALGVERGDRIEMEVLEGARQKHAMTVTGVVTEYLGIAAYMDLTAVNRLMREGPVLSGGNLQVDSSQVAALYRRLKGSPGVAGVVISDLARRSFEETLASVINTVTWMFAMFGAAIAFAVIYNNTRIAFAERARELGSLHVLGFTHAEMAEILLGEMAVLTLVALPVGVLVGRGLGALVVTLFSTELARIPLVIAPKTNGIAIAITLMAAVFSGVAMWRQLLRLDVLASLKAPE
jgi:putative ABC transport system permease protein